jgi:hypothetical protein
VPEKKRKREGRANREAKAFFIRMCECPRHIILSLFFLGLTSVLVCLRFFSFYYSTICYICRSKKKKNDRRTTTRHSSITSISFYILMLPAWLKTEVWNDGITIPTHQMFATIIFLFLSSSYDENQQRKGKKYELKINKGCALFVSVIQVIETTDGNDRKQMRVHLKRLEEASTFFILYHHHPSSYSCARTRRSHVMLPTTSFFLLDKWHANRE